MSARARLVRKPRRLRPERAQRHMDRSLPSWLVIPARVADLYPAMAEAKVQEHVRRWARAHRVDGVTLMTERRAFSGDLVVTIHPNRKDVTA